MKLAMAQMRMGPTAEENLDKTLRRMERAAALDAELIVFPTRQLSPYEAAETAQADGPALAAIREGCRTLGIAAVPGLLLEDGDASLMIGPDGALLGKAGGGAFPVCEIAGVRVGLVVDGERHEPGSVRACVRQGAELVVIPAASQKGDPLWYYERELCALAVLNCCFIALCSRAGQEGARHFAGESLLAGPDGRILLKAGALDGLYVMDIDPAEARNARANCAWLGSGQTDG